MTELLALPEWNTPRTTVADWSARLETSGHQAVLCRDDDGDSWLELAPCRLRGLLELEGDAVVSIHFELSAADPRAAAQLLETAARALGWGIYADEDDVEDSSEI